MERRKLFSDVAPIQRRKLFCDSEVEIAAQHEEPKKRLVVCRDCGYCMETSEESSKLFCPKCGSNRFEEKSVCIKEEAVSEKEFSTTTRRKLFSNVDEDQEFQKEFSTTTDPFELKLKEFSGKELSVEDFQKEFSDYLDINDLQGYGEVSDNKVKIFSDAFSKERLYSCIRMTISKTLELDPETFKGVSTIPGKVAILKKLEEEDGLNPKVIRLIRKAHDIPTDLEDNNWVEDSGICDDLGSEFRGRIQSMPEFKRILDERYPDAPESIIDLLKNHGTIKVEGESVEVI